jgi:hypothetical protein
VTAVLRIVLVLLTLIAGCGSAAAGTTLYDNVRVVPNPAVSKGAIALVVRWSGCSPEGDWTINQSGTLITVRQIDNNTICWSPPPPPRDVSYPLGRLAPGDYTVRFIADFTGRGGTAETTDLPLRVLGAPGPVSVPLLSPPLLLALVFGLLAMAVCGLRRRALQPHSR